MILIVRNNVACMTLMIRSILYGWRRAAVINFLFQIGPRLHKQCKAYSRKKCKGRANVNRNSYAQEVRKKKVKAKKEAENRIVGGKPALDPMPWMVIRLSVLSPVF